VGLVGGLQWLISRAAACWRGGLCRYWEDVSGSDGILLVLEVSRKQEGGIGMTSRFLSVLDIFRTQESGVVRPVEIY
jgi:hypothetical protein